jgi:predicted NUDIX family NTP pyrophosphohydrolase
MLSMPRKQSSGILLYRKRGDNAEVFLVHPGGPFWAKKDVAAWSIPKGEFKIDEDPLAAAQREFTEETGLVLEGPFTALGEVRQAGGKIVYAWAVEGDCDPQKLTSNTFQMEWPPRSGRFAEFPEIDRAAWFTAEAAAIKLHKGQVAFLERLQELLQKA